jgi:hypothetical protein
VTEPELDQQRPTIEWAFLFQWVLATTLGWAIGWAFIGEVGVGIALGLGQWLVLRQSIPQAGWWIWASTVGWAFGQAMIVVGEITPPGSGLINSVAAGTVLGTLLGIAQWFVLRRSVRHANWWVIMSAVGWAIGLTGIFGGTLVGAVAGAVTGLTLDWLLRHPLPEREAEE